MRPPTGNIITQGQHLSSKAVDYSWYRNTGDASIYAPEDGVIESYQQRGVGTSNAGNCIRMNGATGLHQFAHCDSMSVRVGQRVSKGQKIGVMGSTGYAQGRHLHYWVKTPGGYVYPPLLYAEPFGGIIQSNKEDQDMIRPGDEDILRIIASEVKGWDFNSTHNGSKDAVEMAAWKGRDFRQLIREGWAEGGWYRDLKARQANLQTTVDKLNSDLNARPTKAQLEEALAKVQRESEKLAKAEAEKERALALAKENSDKYLEELAKEKGNAEDTKLLDSIKDIISRLVARFK